MDCAGVEAGLNMLVGLEGTGAASARAPPLFLERHVAAALRVESARGRRSPRYLVPTVNAGPTFGSTARSPLSTQATDPGGLGGMR